MRKHPTAVLLLSALLVMAGVAAGQTTPPEIKVEPAAPMRYFGWITRPYSARSVPAISLANSPRMDQLLRAGNLYLTAQDCIALAIENNIDIEVQRYGPLLAQEVLRRAEGGGALRSVGLPLSAGPQSVSLQGVSVNTAGTLSLSGGGVSSGGGIVTQLGPAIPSLDPTVLAFVNFQHATIPQSNTVLTGTTALVQNTRSVQAQYAQNWDFGLSGQLTYSSNYVSVNSNFFALNPYTTGSIDLQFTQNLLQGFGRSVNARNIRVQKNNVKVSDLQFKQQVSTTVSAVLNLYWDLVAFNEDVRAREQAVTTAQQLLEDNKRQVQIGTLAEIEVTRAESQLYAAQQDLVIARTNLMQQETILKNALARNGVSSAGLAGVHIIPLERIAVPAAEQIRPVDDLVAEALANRPEIAQSKINIESNKINLKGIRNSLLPGLQAFVQATNNALTGDLTALGATAPGIGYLAGGYGNLLGQLARRNYPNYAAGFSLSIPLRNRAAQSDYVTSELELRQNELNLRKNENQVRVDVQNAVIGLEQARARYEASVKSRELSDQTLDADRKKYQLGASTAFQVVQDQRDLAAAQSAEVQAMANYTHARVAFDEAMGETLEKNNVSMTEAYKANVSYRSTLPANLPQGVQR